MSESAWYTPQGLAYKRSDPRPARTRPAAPIPQDALAKGAVPTGARQQENAPVSKRGNPRDGM